jgi:hypothetical protein
MGIAQLLMIVSSDSAKQFDGPKQDGQQCNMFLSTPISSDVCVYNLTEREQRIIATIIQWLGTNVGWHFVLRCFRKAGYLVEKVPNPIPPKPVEVLKLKGRFRILRNS